jgi:hypothetical protein
MAFLCVSQQGNRSVKNTKKMWTFFPLSFFSFDFLSRFWLFFCMTSSKLKNAIKTFPKIRPKNLKKSQKKVGR